MRIVVASFSLITAVIFAFISKFSFAVPSQEYSCLYASYFLVDKQSITIDRDRLIAFSLPLDTPYFRKDTRWIKKLVGLPGDQITVTIDAVTVNGKVYKNNMSHLLMKVGLVESEITKSFQLMDDQYFMIGETPLSYDSRFWGTISEEQMLGDVYALL